MYKKNTYTVKSNEPLTADAYRMVLEGDTQYITAPGQFINVRLDGKYLRRPFSVCDYDRTSITIIYKVLGSGTAQMTKIPSGQLLDVLTGLGNGFWIPDQTQAPLLVGGGVGVPPMYNLAKTLIAAGRTPKIVLGFNSASEVFYQEQFRSLGMEVIVATADGSSGVRGFVTDAIRDTRVTYDYVYACGPMGMLEALHRMAGVPGQYSFEERMGCGFGACMGCSCQVKYGYKRICKEGPVLASDEIVW